MSFSLEYVSNDAALSFDFVSIVLSVYIICYCVCGGGGGVGLGFGILDGMLHDWNWGIFRMRHYADSRLVTSMIKRITINIF